MIRALMCLVLALSPLALPAEEPVVLAQGTFAAKSKSLEGGFLIRRSGDRLELVFDDRFLTKAGPDLQIIFSPLTFEAADNRNADGAGSRSIGLLQSIRGAQVYPLPADLDLAKYHSILIHCVKYTKLWGGGNL